MKGKIKKKVNSYIQRRPRFQLSTKLKSFILLFHISIFVNQIFKTLSAESSKKKRASKAFRRAKMSKILCDFRFLLFLAAVAFFYVQVPINFMFMNRHWMLCEIWSLRFRFVLLFLFCFVLVFKMRIFATQSEYSERLSAAVWACILFQSFRILAFSIYYLQFFFMIWCDQ